MSGSWRGPRRTAGTPAGGPLLWIPAILAAALGIWGAGCEDRARTNPFDPGNPATWGEPRLLEAVAADGSVELRWEVGDYDGSERLRILRRIDSGAEIALLDPLPGRQGSIWDQLLPNDLQVVYRLEILAPGGAWLSSRPDTAMPGKTRLWIGDAAGGGVALLSPDGRDLRWREERGRTVLDLEPDPSGGVWIADYGYGAVVQLDGQGERLFSWEVYGVNTLALDPSEAGLWAGSFNRRTIALYRLDGQLAWEDTARSLVERLRAAPGGGVWVSERTEGGEGRVRRIGRGGTLRSWDGFVRPVGIAVDPAGQAWVADPGAGLVSVLSADGSRRDSAPGVLQSPAELDLAGDGGVWVADRGRGGAVYLDATLSERAFLPLPGVTHLAWETGRRLLWATYSSLGRVEAWSVEETSPGVFRVLRRAALETGGRPVVPRPDVRM